MNDLSGCPFKDLVTRRLVNVRFSDNGRLAIFKYSKRVFWDALWKEDPLLLEARGVVLEVGSWKPVQLTPLKVFNLGEQPELTDSRDPECEVVAVRKINGFMAAASVYDGKVLVTTTGSLESPFVELARKNLYEVGQLDSRTYPANTTLIFEICDPSDPHIISEIPGVYLIGARTAGMSRFGMSEDELDDLRDDLLNLGADNPKQRLQRPHWAVMPLKEVLESARTCAHEGFMVRDRFTDQTLFKVKSQYYLTKKLLARGKFFLGALGKQEIKKRVPEEFYFLVDKIFDQVGIDAWKEMSEQKKLDTLSSWIKMGQ